MTFTLDNLEVPSIKKAQKVSCTVVKHLNKGVVVSCENGAFL